MADRQGGGQAKRGTAQALEEILKLTQAIHEDKNSPPEAVSPK